MQKYVLLIFTIAMLVLTGCGSQIEAMKERFMEEFVAPERYEMELSEEELLRKSEMEESGLYPFFDSLTDEEKKIYLRICTSVENYDESEVMLSTYDTKEECESAKERLGEIYKYVVYEQPQYFWMNVSAYESLVWDYGYHCTVGIQMTYVIRKEDAKQKQVTFDKAVNEIVAEAKGQPDTFSQVLYVYDAILSKTTYDHDLAESKIENDLARTAYGCLIEGKTVCSGYAQSFTLVMRNLGYVCSVEFDKVDEEAGEVGHVWNYAKLDNEYYYFDLTWDDTGFDAQEYKQYLEYSHQYFGISTEELPHTRREDSITPACTGRQYNYYVYNGYNMESYSFETAKQILLNQAQNKCMMIRFDNNADFQTAEDELFNKQKIFNIFPRVNEVNYVTSDTQRHLYIYY